MAMYRGESDGPRPVETLAKEPPRNRPAQQPTQAHNEEYHSKPHSISVRGPTYGSRDRTPQAHDGTGEKPIQGGYGNARDRSGVLVDSEHAERDDTA